MIPESENLLLFGQGEPLAEQIELRAGPISLIFEDGCIRYLRYRGREILRRVYAAVRDHEWRTVPYVIRDLKVVRDDESFEVTFVSEHNDPGVHFIWAGRIAGDAKGSITFEFDGEAKTSFRRNRIGFCVLHPPEGVTGAECKATHADGPASVPSFPRVVAQEQPVARLRDLTGLSYEAFPRTWVTTEFEGDIFETEDQRNWIDDSFKTYCTPLSLPLPVLIEAGTRIRQKITVRLEGDVQGKMVTAGAEPIRIVLEPKEFAMTKIGFCATSEDGALAFSALSRLQQLKPAHVRVEALMNEADWQERFAAGCREASALKCKVELALRLSGCPGEDLRDLITTFPEPFQHWAFTSSFARILLTTFGEKSTSKRSLEAFRGFLLKTGLSTLDLPMGAGTEGDLYEFNLQRPPRDADIFFWSMNPQVHAFDVASISETPGGARAQVRSVQEYFGDAPKTISPITLRPRSGDAPVDARQKSLFGAVWTIGMLAALAHGGATSATFFETTGAKGIMDNGGPVFPVYHVFRAIAGCQSAVALKVNKPLAAAACAVRNGEGMRLLVGNYTRDAIEVELPTKGAVTARRLNKETTAHALEQPENFWSASNATDFNESLLRLAPFEIVFLDQPIFPEAF